MRVLMVCLGNICRSPTAEAIFRKELESTGLDSRVEVDSCGLVDHHVGDLPDTRATAAALPRGYDLTDQRARQVQTADFESFDLILAMDASVLQSLRDMAPEGSSADVLPFLGADGASAPRDVPDPYYGGADGFENVLNLIEAGSSALAGMVRERLESAS